VVPPWGSLLLDLYQTRSDCVHGKVPFLELRARGNDGEERAAQLAYVADVLAREGLLAAFRFPDQGPQNTSYGSEPARHTRVEQRRRRLDLLAGCRAGRHPMNEVSCDSVRVRRGRIR
jgi:hypothetical protein